MTTAAATLSRSAPDPSGEPDLFPTDEALSAKFAALSTPVLRARTEAVAGAILGLSRLASISDLAKAARS